MIGSLVVPAVVFLAGAGAVVGGYVALTRLPGMLTRRRIEGRLHEVGTEFLPVTLEGTIIKRAIEGPLPALDRLAARTARGSAIARLIEQAGLKVSVSTIAVMSIGVATMLAALVALFVHVLWAPILAAAVGLLLPTLFLRLKRNQRMRRFEEQFPEALDLLSRAIRAGHAFTTAMGMVADEAMDPVGPEFKKTFDEQNFGLPLKEAMNNLTERVPMMDVRFFVTAVSIQRETGGNLAEILDNLAHVVRERFKILRQVRVYTAHGRLTGYVLMALPAALAIALWFINPDHMNLLFRERMGQMMLTGSIVMQVLGYLWIRQVVKIEV